ncbi:hypothetical protein [Acidiphilium multivorum]|nr:hypothetical protein [Acidiphilium multivorum]
MTQLKKIFCFFFPKKKPFLYCLDPTAKTVVGRANWYHPPLPFSRPGAE